MIFKDYYKILGLENNKVSTNEIKTAYREQAKKYHPDVIGRDNFSEERFKDINEAYKVLSNITTRKKYDRMWNSRVGHKKKNEESKREEGSLFSNFFKMFFGEMETKKEPMHGNGLLGSNCRSTVSKLVLTPLYHRITAESIPVYLKTGKKIHPGKRILQSDTALTRILAVSTMRGIKNRLVSFLRWVRHPKCCKGWESLKKILPWIRARSLKSGPSIPAWATM